MNNDTVAQVAGILVGGSEDWKQAGTLRDNTINAAVDAARNIIFRTETRAWPTTGAQPTGLAARIRALPVLKDDAGRDVVNRGDLLRLLEEANV